MPMFWTFGIMLINIRHDFPWNLAFINLPIRTVLPRTSLFVTSISMQQNCRYEESVEPRYDVRESTRRTRSVRDHQITQVVTMTRNSPET